ncbi:COG1470 family protein [Candidatus Harpocratesius sp.]
MPSKDKININIKELEETILKADNSVDSITCNGKLEVVNPSSAHKIWNVELDIQDTELLKNIQSHYERNVIAPENTWLFEYDIPQMKKPVLEVVEKFDTSKDFDDLNQNFTLNAKNFGSIYITLTNTIDVPIRNIELTKTLADYLKEVKISRFSSGNAVYEGETKQLKWTIDSLAPHESTEIEIEGRATITDSKIKNGNELQVTYSAPNALKSKVAAKVKAITETMVGISSEEDDTKPGWWKCELEFDNDSDFELTITKAEVIHNTEIQDKIIDLDLNVVLPPNESWVHEFSLESVNVPKFSHKVDFTVNYIVETILNGKIVKIPSEFEVLETNVEKDINPPQVKANAKTDIRITNTITNIGTATINELKVIDTIPVDFDVPDIMEINAHLVNANGDTIAKIEQENLKYTISPNDHNVGTPHTIEMNFFKLTELPKKYLPGSKIVITYPIVAQNPQPNEQYNLKISTFAKTLPEGYAFEFTDENPEVKIQYAKRKLKTSKAIQPGSSVGEFRVKIKIKNAGEVELKNVAVEETIPAGFKVANFSPSDLNPEYNVSEGNHPSKVIWMLDIMQPGDQVILSYDAEGSGNFERFEPVVRVAKADYMNRGVTELKQKVESEPKESEEAPAEEEPVKAVIRENKPEQSDSRLICAHCNSKNIGTKEDREHPISYISGSPIYGKKYYCKDCGYEWK